MPRAQKDIQLNGGSVTQCHLIYIQVIEKVMPLWLLT